MVSHSAVDDSEPHSKHASFAHVLRNNALSLVLFALFTISAAMQIATGLDAYNSERADHGRGPISAVSYITSGHFLEAFFENWESEFLQMAVFVALSASLIQKGSAESKPPDDPFEGDEDPRLHQNDPDAPWPVRRGGLWLWLYERSLTLTFAALFLVSFVLHALGGMRLQNEEHALLGKPSESLWEFVSSSQFWFESFQNWQSEFISVFAMVVLTIFLRQRGSPQSKPVAESHSTTGV